MVQNAAAKSVLHMSHVTSIETGLHRNIHNGDVKADRRPAALKDRQSAFIFHRGFVTVADKIAEQKQGIQRANLMPMVSLFYRGMLFNSTSTPC